MIKKLNLGTKISIIIVKYNTYMLCKCIFKYTSTSKIKKHK